MDFLGTGFKNSAAAAGDVIIVEDKDFDSHPLIQQLRSEQVLGASLSFARAGCVFAYNEGTSSRDYSILSRASEGPYTNEFIVRDFQHLNPLRRLGSDHYDPSVLVLKAERIFPSEEAGFRMLRMISAGHAANSAQPERQNLRERFTRIVKNLESTFLPEHRQTVHLGYPLAVVQERKRLLPSLTTALRA